MDTDFEITLQYKGTELLLQAHYVSTGYSYKINVEINGRIISFEPDEERNFRALLNEEDLAARDSIDKKLVEAIALQLVELFR
ncbi:MAG: hypothetical protein EOO04_32310 [Chitinophagaceae bacterium]|nr:MAG: hypothetical protein EOO04_32310 [Chitinophagaceae bacterium]